MNKQVKTTLKYLLFLGFGITLMWWAYKDVDFVAMKSTLMRANWVWIVIALFLNYWATTFRGFRWNTMLQPLGYKANRWTCVHSVAFGYLMNDLIPRSGEVARCTLLNRAEGVPVDKLIGTVIMERIVDMILLLTVILITLLLHRDAVFQLFSWVDGGKGKVLIGVLVFMVVGIFVFLYILRKLRHIQIIEKIAIFFQGIGSGLKTIVSLKQKGLFVTYSLAIWASWTVMTVCMMNALDETSSLGIADALLIVSAASLGMIFPTQGGLGAYHFMLMLAFIAMGFGNEDNPQRSDIGLTFAAISWAGKTSLELGQGAIGFLMVTIFKLKKK